MILLTIFLIMSPLPAQSQHLKLIAIDDVISPKWRLATVQDYNDLKKIASEKIQLVEKNSFALADGFAYYSGHRFETRVDQGNCLQYTNDSWRATCKWKLIIKGGYSCVLREGYKYYHSHTDVGNLYGCKTKCLQHQFTKKEKVVGATIVTAGSEKRCFCTGQISYTRDSADLSCYFVPTRTYDKCEVHVGSFSGHDVILQSVDDDSVDQCHEFCMEQKKAFPSINGMSLRKGAGICRCTKDTQVLDVDGDHYSCFLTCQRNNTQYYEDYLDERSQVDSWGECAELCSFEDSCKFWSYSSRPEERYYRKCFFYGGRSLLKYTKHPVVSGSRDCKASSEDNEVPTGGRDEDSDEEEEKGKGLGFEGNRLLYIAAGIGALIVFIILVVIIVIVLMRRNDKTKNKPPGVVVEEERQRLTETNVDDPPSPSHHQANGNPSNYQNIDFNRSRKSTSPPQRKPPPPPPIETTTATTATAATAATTATTVTSDTIYDDISGDDRTGLLGDADTVYAQPETTQPYPTAAPTANPNDTLDDDQGYSEPDPGIYYSSLGAGGGRTGARPAPVERSTYAQVKADDDSYPCLSQPDAVTGLYDVVEEEGADEGSI